MNIILGQREGEIGKGLARGRKNEERVTRETERKRVAHTGMPWPTFKKKTKEIMSAHVLATNPKYRVKAPLNQC